MPVALSISQTKALGSILKPGMRVVSMGYPDIIAPNEIIEELLGENKCFIRYRDDSEVICNRHRLTQRKIPDTESLFDALGCKLDVFDIVRERGCEILCDLNYPIVPRETYDIVLDVGTLEHCFNIGQAAFNMAGLVKVGGFILHENPFNWGNHGLYGLNPAWYFDFYEQNGFKLLACRLIPRGGHDPINPPLISRFVFTGQEANIFAVARRDEMKELVYPMQTKYNPAAGVRAIAAAEQRAKET